MEVCLYDMSSDSIEKNFNLLIVLAESTANVSRIADITFAEAFDGDSVLILDSDNVRIPDSVGTRGMHCHYTFKFFSVFSV